MQPCPLWRRLNELPGARFAEVNNLPCANSLIQVNALTNVNSLSQDLRIVLQSIF